MPYDSHSKDGRFYHVNNLYFDTEDFHAIRSSIERPKYKEKLRMRSYECIDKCDDFVFLEMKKKIDGLIVKRRIHISYKEAMDFILYKNKPITTTYQSTQVAEEIDYYLSQKCYIPKVFIGYERLAFASQNGDSLRITFDKDIVSRKTKLDFSSCEGIPLLKEKEVLLEIKSSQNFPLWLVTRLNDLSIYSRTFSKVGEAYKYYCLGEKR